MSRYFWFRIRIRIQIQIRIRFLFQSRRWFSLRSKCQFQCVWPDLCCPNQWVTHTLVNTQRLRISILTKQKSRKSLKFELNLAGHYLAIIFKPQKVSFFQSVQRREENRDAQKSGHLFALQLVAASRGYTKRVDEDTSKRSSHTYYACFKLAVSTFAFPTGSSFNRLLDCSTALLDQEYSIRAD